MPVFGAITYNRRSASAAYAVWPDKQHSEETAPAIAQADRAQITDFINDAKPLPSDLLLMDVLSEDYRALSPEKREKLGKAYIGKLVKYLKASNKKYDHITIAGQGPFRWGTTGTSSISTLFAQVDTPFAGMDLRKIVAEAMNMKNVSVITDVTAVGIAEYWATWRETLYTVHEYQSVVASIIVERGIGAAVVQKKGEAVGQFHYSQAGHIRVKRHPKDRLPERDDNKYCWHCNDCLTAYAGLLAIEQRARLYAAEQSARSAEHVNFKADLQTLFDNPDHEIWQVESYYLAQLCLSIVLLHAPSKIVMGGELISNAPFLLDMIRNDLSGFLTAEELQYNGIEPGRFSSFLKAIDREKAMLVGALLHSLKQKSG